MNKLNILKTLSIITLLALSSLSYSQARKRFKSKTEKCREELAKTQPKVPKHKKEYYILKEGKCTQVDVHQHIQFTRNLRKLSREERLKFQKDCKGVMGMWMPEKARKVSRRNVLEMMTKCPLR